MSLINFSKKSKLGIDIGTASVKIVELSKESGRFKLENYCLFELESIEGALNIAGEISKSQADQADKEADQNLAWGIKEALKRGKIKAKDAVVSIPSFNTFSTIISMPYLSESDIAKAVPYEAKKYIPIPLNEVVMDWTIIGANNNPNVNILSKDQTDAKQPNVDVFIVAVPKNETERYKSIIKSAELNLKALELENTALVRALIGNDLGPFAIINIGGRSTSILIVDKGYERISHNYEVGGFEITKAIARSLNVSLKRAEELKRSLGLKNANADMITESMSSLVDLIVFETQKIIHNYEDTKKTKIGQVLLVGSSANMPMFMEYFGSKLNLPISAGNPLARLIFPPALEPLRGELNSTYPIAIGLAMREI